jgi:tRNA(fMet)-specific endonuclease VapC
MRKVLLDTSAYSYLLRGNKLIHSEIESADQVFVSAVVIAELLIGFANGTRSSQNKQLLADFLSQPTVVQTNITQETAEVYQQVYSSLAKKGTPIPINDVWIAAQSLEMGAKLLTCDKHFEQVPGLRLLVVGVEKQ